MDIYYSHYALSPLKRANRLSSLEPKPGVYLKAVSGGKVSFADYFPHIPLGDRPVDEFLATFKNQQEEYERKIFELLLRDREYQHQGAEKFRNHQLWTGSEPLEADVIKYKLMSAGDRTFFEPLRRGLRVRLDGNGIFSHEGFKEFLADFSPQFRQLVDYIEDPLRDEDWRGLGLPAARDFLNGTPYEYYIYKPNCEFLPEKSCPIIFSAYLASDLNAWHTYCELIRDADKALTHGIVGQGFYQEERGLFKGPYSGIVPDLNVVRNIYQELQLRSWNHLCKI